MVSEDLFGVDPALQPVAPLPRVNATLHRPAVAAELERTLADYFAAPSRALAERWCLDLSAWPSLRAAATVGAAGDHRVQGR